MSGLRVAMFLGSLREGRMNDRVAKAVRSALEKREMRVSTFDPLEREEYHTLRKPIHFYGKGEEVPKYLVDDNQTLLDCDAYIIVTPEYNRCIPGGLSNMINHFPPATYASKPVGVVSYSPSKNGGSSCAIQLREYVTELAMICVQKTVSISQVSESVSADGMIADERLESALQGMLDQVVWYGSAMKNAREQHGRMPL